MGFGLKGLGSKIKSIGSALVGGGEGSSDEYTDSSSSGEEREDVSPEQKYAVGGGAPAAGTGTGAGAGQGGGGWTDIGDAAAAAGNGQSGEGSEERAVALADVRKFAVYLGMDPDRDRELLWIAVEAMRAPIPEGWGKHRSEAGRSYFFHAASETSQWEHPTDQHYRDLFQKKRFGGSPTSPDPATPPASRAPTAGATPPPRHFLL
ncbi:hypothetical protein T484DRAFT_1883624, partial [Baffinella frigidus]